MNGRAKAVPVESELAWAAGFFDGEGCFYCRNRYGKYKYFNMEVAQLDRRPLDRFTQAVGLGKVIERKGRKTTKPHFLWALYDQEDVKMAVNKLWPYLSDPKKEQITGKGGSCGI